MSGPPYLLPPYGGLRRTGSQLAQSVDAFTLMSDLGRENVEEDVDRLEDALVGEAISHEASVAGRDDDAFLSQGGEMLRGVALSGAQRPRELAHRQALPVT